MRARFNPPPGWPAPPEGWQPDPGWRPDPSWPAAPPGWQFWTYGAQSPPRVSDGRDAEEASQLAGGGMGRPGLAPPAVAAVLRRVLSLVQSRGGLADRLGWGGLALAVLVGAITGGFSGAAAMAGWFVLIVGLVALLRGGVRWARLGSRARGGAAVAGGLVAITIAGSPGPASQPDSLAVPTTAQPSIMTSQAAPAPSPSSPTDSATSPGRAAKPGTALAALATLAVMARAPMTGYQRGLFGAAWTDTDGNGCDQRNDVLRRDLGKLTLKAGTRGCAVWTGTLRDPYTGRTVAFARASSSNSSVEIDHVVPLADAWVKGAASWTMSRRTAFANDPLNLLAVSAQANAAKANADAATWLPPAKAYRCTYVARQVAVKAKYALSVTAAERDAVADVLTACPTAVLPKAKGIPLGGAPLYLAPAPAPTRAPTASPKPPPPPQEQPDVATNVHPGAFCSTEGALGRTAKGTLMQCSYKPGDSRLRWRSP